MNEKQKMKKIQSQEKSQEEKYNKKRMMGKKEHMRSMNMKGKGVEGCCPMYVKKQRENGSTSWKRPRTTQ